ncbi:hypothetical protein J0H58_10780 [bacterium]|nr:hypothetical protein [bacterium]
MARVTVRRSDARDLPPVCCVCGKDATQSRSETFHWAPPWVLVFLFFGVVTWVFAAMLLRRTVKLVLPVCDRHVRRSKLAWWVSGVGLLVAFAVGFGSHLVPAFRQTDVILGAILFGLFTLVVAVGLADDRVRPKHIDDRSVTLDRVSDAFAEAVGPGGRGPERRSPVPAGGMELVTARYYRG